MDLVTKLELEVVVVRTVEVCGLIGCRSRPRQMVVDIVVDMCYECCYAWSLFVVFVVVVLFVVLVIVV